MKEVGIKAALEAKQFVAVWKNAGGIWSGTFRLNGGHFEEFTCNDWVPSHIEIKELSENVNYNMIEFFA
jgi:hypothetical protein